MLVCTILYRKAQTVAPQTPINRIFVLLVPIIILTVIISYIPHELTLIRQALSLVQLGFMTTIAVITVRFVLEDF